MSAETETPENPDFIASPAATTGGELVGDEKVIEFTDQRGILRRPHAEAAECYASPEIQLAVGEHFEAVDAELASIDEQLATIETQGIPEVYDPLSDEFLHELLDTAVKQLPTLTKTQPVTKQVEVTKGLFKRKKTETQTVEEDVPVDGYVADGSDSELSQPWRDISYIPLRSEGAQSEESLAIAKKEIQSFISKFLTGTEQTSDERRAGKGNQRKLPLLATRLRDAGISAVAAQGLSWAEVVKLVPEAGRFFEDVARGTDRQNGLAEISKLRELTDRLFALSPQACQSIARIYYNDELLDKLSKTNDAIKAMLTKAYLKIYPEYEPTEQNKEYIQKQIESIRGFFDGRIPADALFVHGTPFTPRVIKSGHLRSTHSMSDEEFTFNTDRSHTGERSGVTSIEGSRGVHWAALGQHQFARDLSHESTERMLRARLMERFRNDESRVERELSEGPVGSGRLAIRFGDLVGVTPYGGDPHTSHIHLREQDQEPRARLGVIELTPTGWVQVQDRLDPQPNISDAAYVSAPEHREPDQIYDFSYPLDSFLIGMPSKDQETIPNALRARGWSDEQIAAATYVYTEFGDEMQQLQAAVYTQPKFARSVVAPIRLDL